MREDLKNEPELAERAECCPKYGDLGAQCLCERRDALGALLQRAVGGVKVLSPKA